MLKYSSLVLLVAVATFWSFTNAKPNPSPASMELGPYKRSLGLHKGENSGELSKESEDYVKEMIVGLLTLTAETSAEKTALKKEYRKALKAKWDSLDEFSDHVARVYGKVTGRKLD